MPNKLVIVAEDDDLLRHLYDRKFSLAGYDILTASSGDEALQLISNNDPALVILDINMHGIDGFQVLEKLPAKDRSFPVFMLSNFNDGANVERAKELGADRFIEKQNITIKELLATIKSTIDEQN
ncbi:response regulator [Candidatus Peregrinibacteria bacterium]|nr:response regulator [Candidatus Peregrinibacteria bacterium]